MVYLSIFLILIGLICYKIRNKEVVSEYQKYGVNRYVNHHKQYTKDEAEYSAYLDWCLENEEIPMNEIGFEDIRSRRNEIKKAIN